MLTIRRLYVCGRGCAASIFLQADIMDGPILITFGVELEFYIRFKPSDYEQAIEQLISHKPQWRWINYHGLLLLAVQLHMIIALKEHQIAVNDIDVAEDNFTKWTVATDTTIQPTKDDSTHGDPDFSFEGIELKSPALPYSSQSVEHISMVISIINQTFNPSVNTSTGFHVHVGNRTAGFTLQTLKNFASLVTVFQRQIQSIHAEERLENLFCAAPSKIFRQQPPLEIAKHIHSIFHLGDLLNIFIADGNRFQAYNFENLRRRLKTIEFRQHRGTMDCEEISNYIHLVCGLVCASHLAGPAGFTDLIIRYATDPYGEHYSFLHLLADLQLDRLIPYYSTRLRSHRRQSHEWHPGLKSPEISADDEEDTEESEDVQRPAWTGSPDFEMRPIRLVMSPEGAPYEPEEHRPLKNEEDPAMDRESHDEAQNFQHSLRSAWPSRGSDATPGRSWDADLDEFANPESQEDLQGSEDSSQESEAAPKPLTIANPDIDPHSESEEDLEEPAEWRDFDWDWREHALQGQHPDLAGLEDFEDYSQEPEAAPRPLGIANPDADFHSESEEALEPIEEHTERNGFIRDWREQVLQAQHPESAGLQDFEDYSQESEATPRPLRIANPEADSHSESEED